MRGMLALMLLGAVVMCITACSKDSLEAECGPRGVQKIRSSVTDTKTALIVCRNGRVYVYET